MATTKKTTATKKATNAPKKEKQQQPVPVAPQPQPEPMMKTIMIPLDPSFESKDQMWEWNLNGNNILIKRGEWVTLAAEKADAIMEKLWKRDHVSAFVADFKDKSKKLN